MTSVIESRTEKKTVYFTVRTRIIFLQSKRNSNRGPMIGEASWEGGTISRVADEEITVVQRNFHTS